MRLSFAAPPAGKESDYVPPVVDDPAPEEVRPPAVYYMSLRKKLCSVDFGLRLAAPCLQAPCTPTVARVATCCACTLSYRLGSPAGSCLTAAAATGAATAATAGCGGHDLAGPRAGGGARVGWEGFASRWWASRHRMPCASCQHNYSVCILGVLLNISLAIFVIPSYYPPSKERSVYTRGTDRSQAPEVLSLRLPF